ncbi:hypothetical protein H5T53_02915, partial [Candidatus Bipolaricaulota bacterium]|nr:hypothetical protein [Candidatus Bipolaricaulota bacterium]
VRVYLGFYYGSTPEVLVQFSGHIAEPFVSAGNGTVTARLKDRAWALEHARHSTTLYMPGTPSGYSGYPDDYIGALLDLVPLADRPSTDLDRGCFPLMFAWLDDDPLWEELGRVAAVQGGMVWFDKAGTLVFRDASFFVLNATSVHTFTTARDLQESWREADIWNHVVVRWSGGRVARLAELWAQTEPLPPLRAGDSTTVQANFGAPAYAVATPVADTDYRAVRHDGMEATKDLRVSAAAYAQRVMLTLTNEGSAPLYVTKLRLRGWPVDFQDEQTTEAEDAASIATYGRRTLQVRLLYVQSRGQAEAVRDFLLHRYKEPRATYSLRVRAIPWLEVGDRVTVRISRTGHDEDFFVMGMRQEFSARGGYWQTLTLLRCADLLPYSNWFVVGTTAYGTAGRWFF